jgi:hypothetical protein
MNRKSFYIGLLSLSATLLALVNYFWSQPAGAQETIKDRDFAMVTARTQTGGDALYVLDNMTGHLAVFNYDPSAKMLRVRQVRDVGSQIFAPPSFRAR